MNKKPTLKDVARIAGVSLGSASAALSNPEKLKPQTRDKILEVIKSIGYIKNDSARALVSKKTNSIAIIVPTIDNPLYSGLVASAQKILSAHHYHLLIGTHEYEFEQEYDVIRSMVEKGIDGLIILGSQHTEDVYQLLKIRNIPYVLSLSLDETKEHHSVGFSNFQASYSIAKVVVNMGHRKIALCGGSHTFNERAREREAGAISALSESKIKIPEHWKLRKALSIEGGREAFRKLWSYDEKPTALICGTDYQALGAIDEAKKYNVKIPSQLSITGFDDIEFASLCTPSLTTMKVPFSELGSRSALHLLDMINGNNPIIMEPIATSLILRNSLSVCVKS